MVVSTLSISILYFLMMCSGAPGQMTFFWAVRSHNREFHLLRVFDGDVEQRALYLFLGDSVMDAGSREPALQLSTAVFERDDQNTASLEYLMSCQAATDRQ